MTPIRLRDHHPWHEFAAFGFDADAWQRVQRLPETEMLEVAADRIRFRLGPTMLAGRRIIELHRAPASEHTRAWMCYPATLWIGPRSGAWSELGEAAALLRAASNNRRAAWIFGRNRVWGLLIWALLIAGLAVRVGLELA